MEPLGALRRGGLLTATAAGWRWDEAAVRAHLGRSEMGGWWRRAPRPCRSSPGQCCSRWRAWATGDYALVYALLTAALPVVGPGGTGTLAGLHAGRHTALYCLGRLEEADEVYRTIERLCPAVLDRADATAVQVRSVTHRTHFAEALRLAVEQSALRRVTTLVARATPPQEVFAAESGRLLAADFAVLVRFDPPDTLEVVGTYAPASGCQSRSRSAPTTSSLRR